MNNDARVWRTPEAEKPLATAVALPALLMIEGSFDSLADLVVKAAHLAQRL